MDNEKTNGKLTTPLSEKGVPKFVIYLLMVIGIIYLLNPGAGFIELIPDIIPIVGNLDEGLATMLIWYGLVEIIDGGKKKGD